MLYSHTRIFLSFPINLQSPGNVNWTSAISYNIMEGIFSKLVGSKAMISGI